jgi:hypothetical protein
MRYTLDEINKSLEAYKNNDRKSMTVPLVLLRLGKRAEVLEIDRQKKKEYREKPEAKERKKANYQLRLLKMGNLRK